MRNKLVALIVSIFMWVSACGLPPIPAGVGVGTNAPYVVSVTPQAGSTLTDWPVIEIIFSEPVLESSVNSNSLFIIGKSDYAEYDASEWMTLYDDVRDGRVETIGGTLTFFDGDTRVLLTPEPTDISEGEYLVVAMPAITTTAHEPLNQMAAGDIFRQFSASFSLSKQALDMSGGASVSEGTNDDSSAVGIIIEEADSYQPESSSPSSVQDDQENLAEEGASEGDDAAAAAYSEPPPFDFEQVLITEIVTDPQQDHGESTFGNGIAFDGVVGTGTIGSTDEYFEIYNGTPESVDLTGWNVTMIDGSDVTESVDDPAWAKFFSAGGSLENFLSGEILVLGNPAGDMKNTIQIELTDQTGQVVHSVYADDANASGTTDESFGLDEAGNWSMGAATPGKFDL